MPFIGAIVGAVVGAVGAVAGAIGAAVGAIGAAVGIGGTLGSLVGGLALSAGLSLISKALRGSTDPPPARGSVTQVTLDPGAPLPYGMGEGPLGGTVLYDLGYGTSLSGVDNPRRWMPILYSTGGPIESLAPRVDGDPIDTGYYGGFLATSTQLGACPESSALAVTFDPGSISFWDSTYKLSGEAAIGWNFTFDRDGKVFASGLPKLTGYGKWAKVYDPRKDSTRPGGSGSHRLGIESTYEWSENPALHAGTYAYGRYQNGKRVFGCGLPDDAIDWGQIAAWANVCDANYWRLFGEITEPGDRWANMKDICAAGGAQPIPTGGKLGFFWQAPRVSLETITEADLADDDMSATAGRTYRDRINTVIPKYRSPDHDWEMVDADPVQVAAYVTEDGEEKAVNWPFNFVKDVDQAAQLARYVIGDARELQPIEVVCNIQFRSLAPGDAVDLYLPSLGLNTQAVILLREVDWVNMKVRFVLIGETPAKHAFALTTIGGAPPAPALGQTGAERDEITWAAARGVRPGEPVGDPSGGVTGGDVADTVLPGGGVAPDKVDTAAILNNAVSAATTLQSGTTTSGSGGYQTLVSGSVTLTAAGRIYVHTSANHSYTGALPQAWTLRIKVDGSVVGSVGGSGGYTDAPNVSASVSVTAGPHTIAIEWSAGGINIFNDTTFIMGIMK